MWSENKILSSFPAKRNHESLRKLLKSFFVSAVYKIPSLQATFFTILTRYLILPQASCPSWEVNSQDILFRVRKWGLHLNRNFTYWISERNSYLISKEVPILLFPLYTRDEQKHREIKWVIEEKCSKEWTWDKPQASRGLVQCAVPREHTNFLQREERNKHHWGKIKQALISHTISNLSLAKKKKRYRKVLLETELQLIRIKYKLYIKVY